MTPAERIALAILEGYAGPYYTAATDTQRARVVDGAADAIEPLLAEMVRAAVKATEQNPT